MAETANNATPRESETQTVCCPNCKTSFSVAVERPAEVRGHELTRRARSLVDGVKRGAFGKPICPICGKAKQSDWSLVNHLRREHFEELQDDMFYRLKDANAC